MRAKLRVALAGDPPRRPGSIVEGADALALVQAGFATPLREEPVMETADAPKVEKTVRKPRAKKD